MQCVCMCVCGLHVQKIFPFRKDKECERDALRRIYAGKIDSEKGARVAVRIAHKSYIVWLIVLFIESLFRIMRKVRLIKCI